MRFNSVRNVYPLKAFKIQGRKQETGTNFPFIITKRQFYLKYF